MKKILIAFLISFLTISLFAGGSSEKPAVEIKNVITMDIPVDPDGLDPQLTASASTFQITSNIY